MPQTSVSTENESSVSLPKALARMQQVASDLPRDFTETCFVGIRHERVRITDCKQCPALADRRCVGVGWKDEVVFK